MQQARCLKLNYEVMPNIIIMYIFTIYNHRNLDASGKFPAKVLVDKLNDPTGKKAAAELEKSSVAV